MPRGDLPRILLVDDQEPNLLALEAVLQPLELHTVRATSGAEALGHLADGDFVAVLLDVAMPGMDGFETASAIRQTARTREVPLIFVTAIDLNSAERERGYALGAFDCLTKPLDPQALRAKVAALVDLWHRGESLRLREMALYEQERAALRYAVQQTEADLRLIIDGVRDHAISLLDPEGRVRTFNAPAERIKGYSLAEVQGRHFEIFFTAEDRADGLPQRELKEAAAHGRFEIEGWRQRKNGSKFYAAVSLSAIRDASGELVGFVKVTQDITHRRQRSEALRASEAQFRLIVDAIPGLVAYVNRDKTYRTVNRSYCEWFGIPIEQASGKPMADIIGEAALAVLHPHLDLALTGRVVAFEAEVPYARVGSRRVRAEYVPAVGSTGEVRGVIT